MTTKHPSTPITQQPRSLSKLSLASKLMTDKQIDHEICETSWSSGLCDCQDDDKHNCLSSLCCWPFFKYTLSMRIGESPFVSLIPCAVFALRVKLRTVLSVKGSIVDDFFAALCCEPCVVCQMSRELDNAGL
ncbi:cornifelin homolog [Argonauta hians]